MAIDLQAVISLAKESASVLRENFGKPSAEEVIGRGFSGDITRKADALAERFILKKIKELGNAEILSEEAGHRKYGTPEYRWIIDPLDGSTNYIRGIPLFALSILVERLPSKEPWLAVVLDPVRDQCFSAERRKGAWLNGKPLQTRKRRRFEDSIFYLDLHFGKNKAKFNKFLGSLRSFGFSLDTFRSFGSCALALAYTASGGLDGFLDLSKNSRYVDVAAGILILEEAGGFVTDLYGNPIADDYDTLIACSSDAVNLRIRKMIIGEDIHLRLGKPTRSNPSA